MVNKLLIASTILFIYCTPPPPIPPAKSAPTPQSSKLKPSLPLDSTAATPIRQDTLPLPEAIPIFKWPGLSFVVLPKQEILRRNGYELYTCRPGACVSVTVDTAWELANHRIQCDRLSGEFLFVESVERAKDEWLIIFNYPKADKKLYATTREQALIDIAPASDLDGAKKRWHGTTVFARRGVISTFGSNSASSFTSLHIDIKDSLKVTDVRWGITPLPVKPIWLMVVSRTGKTGFIPVRYSWTNTMQRQVGVGLPWEEDIFEQNPSVMYQWDDATWEVVNNHRVVLEMTEEQVRISWGDPVSIGSARIGQDAQTVWNYASQQLFFLAQRLVAIRELPLPGK